MASITFFRASIELDRDRIAHIGGPTGVDDLVVVEARVGPQRERSRGARGAHPIEALGEKAGRSPVRVGVAAAQARVHHVAGARHRGHQRVIAPHHGVAEHAPLLGESVGLTDGRVDIDRHRRLARPGSGGPGPPQQLARHLVELAGVAPAEGSQKGAERRRGQHPVAQAPPRCHQIAVRRRHRYSHRRPAPNGPRSWPCGPHWRGPPPRQDRHARRRAPAVPSAAPASPAASIQRSPPDARRRMSRQGGRGCGKIRASK